MRENWTREIRKLQAILPILKDGVPLTKEEREIIGREDYRGEFTKEVFKKYARKKSKS